MLKDGSFEFLNNNLKRLCQKVETDVKVKQGSGFIIDSVLQEKQRCNGRHMESA